MATWPFRIWATAIVVFFGARMFVADPTAEGGVLGYDAALRVGGPSKLLAFLLATVFALRIAASLETDNAARNGWRTLGLGFGGFAVGQGVLVVHQLAISGPTPFPGIADLAFLLGYAGLALALLGLTRAFADSGLAVGTDARHLREGAAAAGVVGLGAMALLLGSSDAPWPALAVSVAYPALDCVLLVPAGFLTRIAITLRHGRLAAVWPRLLAGIASFTLGDIAFALLTAFGIDGADPFLDLCFTSGYLLAAWGCHTQLTILRGS